jgi:hypothetical protein
MASLRFAAARDVFEAFPTAFQDIAAKPTDQPPLDYLRALAKGSTPDDALAFCAYLLPRREAVWWASQCVRALLATPTHSDEAALRAAEAWVYEPEEDKRQVALEIGRTADRNAATTWVARAAAWSGGSLLGGDRGGPPAPPQMTAQAVRIALQVALVGKADRVVEIHQCVERGVRIAQG